MHNARWLYYDFELQRRKDLTATEGHVVLLEYFEEHPLMLSHPGSLSVACHFLFTCLWKPQMMLLVASLSAMPASQTGNHDIAASIHATSCPLRRAFVNVLMFSPIMLRMSVMLVGFHLVQAKNVDK